MAEPAGVSTRVSKVIEAPRASIYRACLDPEALASWRVPDNMEGHVHAFDAREGGAFRMSLTYDDPAQSAAGKTSAGTDTFQSRFVELIPNERIVEVVEFESPNPEFAGEMRVTTTLVDAGGGTEVTLLFEGIPTGISPEDNRVGTEEALRKLAALIE